jgi:hypothetical protein
LKDKKKKQINKVLVALVQYVNWQEFLGGNRVHMSPSLPRKDRAVLSTSALSGADWATQIPELTSLNYRPPRLPNIQLSSNSPVVAEWVNISHLMKYTASNGQ